MKLLTAAADGQVEPSAADDQEWPDPCLVHSSIGRNLGLPEQQMYHKQGDFPASLMGFLIQLAVR